MNSIGHYLGLIADDARMDAFGAAIRESVRPGDRVLEIGTGLGTFAFMAAAAGAREVVAVESGPVLHVAKTLGLRNGFGDRIRWVRGIYPDDVQIEGRFDVVIFEDFPTVFENSNVSVVLGALRERHLAPGGRLLPSEVRFAVAPVDAEVARRVAFRGLSDDRMRSLHLDSDLLREQASASPVRVYLDPENMPAVAWTSSWRPVGEFQGGASGALEPSWLVDSDRSIGGLAVWFDLRPSSGHVIQNGPGADSVWGQTLFPLRPPVSAEAGSVLSARIERDESAEGLPGWARWEARCGDVRRAAHEFRGAFVDLPGSD